MHRGLPNRERQAWRAGQGSDADRQRSDRSAPYHHDWQRSCARHRDRHLRQERPGRSGGCRTADAADGTHYGWRYRLMTTEDQSMAARARGWGAQLAQFAAALALVFLAKGAIAEPFYVPSGSMEPTLQIGDA